MVYSGKRGIVYRFFSFAIKVERKGSMAVNRIKNEAKWLRVLNKIGIGPKIYFSGNQFIVMKFINGKPILEYLKTASELDRVIAVKEVLRQCRTLDKLNVDKLEMHRPLKHIIINKKKIVMIDFEKCKYSRSPKNVTQFMQFLSRLGFVTNKTKSVYRLRNYKDDYSEENFERLLELVTC